MLFRLGAEAQFVDVVDDLPQVVAALDAVFDLAEDFANLVFDGVRPGGFVVFEGVEVFQEQQPGCLFGVVELAGAADVFPEDVVDVLEGLFKH